jgi:hypothetical protein
MIIGFIAPDLWQTTPVAGKIISNNNRTLSTSKSLVASVSLLLHIK